MKEPITLAILAKGEVSLQEIFDQVATHLLTQMDRSIDGFEKMKCMYRGPRNLKCAAGCLISDDEYRKHMEGRPWDQTFPMHFRQEIRELQRIHDEHEPCNWRELITNFAATNVLLMTTIDLNLKHS